MRRTIAAIGLLAGLVLTVGWMTVAQPVLISGAISTTNDTGDAKTGLHVIVISDTDIGLEGPGLGGMLWVDGVLAPHPTVLNNDTQRVSLDWSVPIPDGASVVVTYVGREDSHSQFGVLAFFTPRIVSFDNVPALGWRVVCCGWVYLKNANRFGVEFSNLEIYRPIAITFESMLATLETTRGSLPWDGLSAGSVCAAAGDTFDDAGFLTLDAFDLDPGDFLLVKLDVSLAGPGFAGSDATILIGHEHQATCGI